MKYRVDKDKLLAKFAELGCKTICSIEDLCEIGRGALHRALNTTGYLSENLYTRLYSAIGEELKSCLDKEDFWQNAREKQVEEAKEPVMVSYMSGGKVEIPEKKSVIDSYRPPKETLADWLHKKAEAVGVSDKKLVRMLQVLVEDE